MFRYEFPDLKDTILNAEKTRYKISTDANSVMMKYDVSYENFFPMENSEQKNDKWGYPSLFQIDDNSWLLISEADVKRNNSASFLKKDIGTGDYLVEFPQSNDALSGSWLSPWRVLMIGDLDQIVRSTLITDVSEPSKITDTA